MRASHSGSTSRTLLLPRVALSAIVTSVASAGGCTSLYRMEEPVGPTDTYRLYHNRHTALRDGSTTRAELERVWGPADFQAPDAPALAAYRWQLVRREKDLLLGGKDAAYEPTEVLYFSMLLRFDDAGVLREHRKLRHKVAYGGPPALPDLLVQWQEGYFR